MKEITTPEVLQSFDLKAFLQVVNDYIQADEVERALWLLGNLPGRLRDFPPPELISLKQDILGAMVTPHAYMSCNLDAKVETPIKSAKLLQWYLRGILILEEVKRYNKQGLVPHIIDIGPGEYFIPLGLMHLGMKFTYWDIAMDKRTGPVAYPYIEEVRQAKPTSCQPVIFLALEVIEHLPATTDLVIEAYRHGHAMPERIHLSTPMYTFNGDIKDWNKPCGLPHLRTYTPTEFLEAANHLFPKYQWELYQSAVMSLRGCRYDKLEPQLLTEQHFEDLAKQNLDLNT